MTGDASSKQPHLLEILIINNCILQKQICIEGNQIALKFNVILTDVRLSTVAQSVKSLQFAVKTALSFEQGTIYTTEHHISVVIFNVFVFCPSGTM